jgi:3-oxoacyl-[acyl-carrier-protein] synthase I
VSGRRVAITGVGIVSCMGNSFDELIPRLRRGESGVRAVPAWAELGIKSLVAGTLEGLDEATEAAAIPKRLRPGMSDAALYCSIAARQAVTDAGLTAADLASPRTACIVGSGTGSIQTVYEAATEIAAGRIRRVSPFTVLRCMASSASAAVANLLGVRGPSYSLSSACATSTHCIGHAAQLVRWGVADVALAGGGEDLYAMVTGAFQGLRIALSTRYNETPARASRPYDADRDGFVIAGGGGMVVLEELERARRRGARLRGELAGYAAGSDGHDLVLPEPSGEQAAACLRSALADAAVSPREVGYVNTHGTSTVAGDVAELRALRLVFEEPARGSGGVPPFSSTKSMTGHSIGAAGAHELIYCLAMMEGGFLAPSINIERPDPELAGLPVLTEAVEARPAVMLSSNFGFGGTNAALVVRRAEG